MDGFLIDGHAYLFSTWLFLRGLGLIYAIAFISLGVQVKGLLGRKGISPAAVFLERVRSAIGRQGYLAYPTLAWFASGDGFLFGGCILGAGLGLLLMLNVHSTLILILLWALYLSMINVGQEYLSYQWDVLLVEAGFLAIFLCPPVLFSLRLPGAPSPIVLLLLRLLVFRLMFMSGALKWISHDPTWHSLTAMEYHYETQPLPTPLAFPLKWAPRVFNRFSTAAALLIETIPPILFFSPWMVRVIAALLIIGLQVLIELTGNFAFFNLLAILLCIPLLDDRFFSLFLPAGVLQLGAITAGAAAAWPLPVLILIGIVLGGVGLLFIAARLSAHTGVLRALNPLIDVIVAFRLVNPYGLFVSMTTQRPEIILEGSQDGKTWSTYEFKYKVGDPKRAPRFVAPHQPRLDWQMWFAALGSLQENAWFLHFVERLLTGSQPVVRLLRTNPFPDQPPRYLRAKVYDYHYATPAEKRETGAWWKRVEEGEYLPVVSLQTEPESDATAHGSV